MKRSQINNTMRQVDAFLHQHQFHLPPFAYWTPEEWGRRGEEVREIAERGLGWDITDFGQEDYQRIGLFVFTLRNGQPGGQGKNYCEKVLVVGVDQVTPMHFHWSKTEDIINRGGGELAVQLYNAAADETLADTPVQVSMDGERRTLDAGTTVVLKPGESITLEPRCYHKFWGVGERVLVGEVSKVNDDHTDNRFFEPVGRFPAIEEDEAPLHLLVNDYERYYRGAR
ncbi:MAG: D-lyxose/D-mannose family sugar isomerase [Candidatus Latescibacteria bacterium]|nr:D-lyxose/D-mannose family sugar isomerase [Candidatus Latescibacterota bacterium]